MRSILKVIKKMQRNFVYYILTLVDISCVAIYYFSIKNLEKPAGLIQAIKFLSFNPNDYSIAIFSGIIAWLIFCVLMISVAMEIPLIGDLFDDYINGDDYSYRSYDNEYFEEIDRRILIINIILFIITAVLNTIFLKYLLWLLFIPFVIILMMVPSKR